MPRVERICPECGASNSFNKTRCANCRAPLTGAPEPPKPAVSPLSRRGMAGLAWMATKYLTRVGFDLAKRRAQTTVSNLRDRRSDGVKHETIDGEVEQAPEPRAAVPEKSAPLRNWRVYSTPPAPAKPDEPERLSWGKKK